MGQLRAQDGSLQGIQPAVRPHDVVVILGLGAVDPEESYPLGQLVIVGDDHPSIAVGAQVLAGEETEDAEVTGCADLATLVLRSYGLGSVLNDVEIELLSDSHDLVHVGRLAVEVHRNDGSWLVACGEDAVEVGGVEVECFGVDVHEDRLGAGICNRSRGGEEGEAGDDYFVSRADPQGSQGEEQGIRAAGYPDGVLDPTILGHSSFELLHLRAEDEPARLQHPPDGGVDLRLDQVVLTLQIQ